MRNIEKKLINKYNEFINEKINKLKTSVEEKGGGKKIETLCNKKWGVFVLSEIFEIKSTSSGIDKNKLINKKGRIPYITRTDENNGITDFIDKQSEKYTINECNVITIGLDTQTAFYQGNKFYTGQNIQIIYNKQLNKYNALFLIHLLKKLMEKFNWGGNGATLNRLNKSKILLPLDSKKNPDWNFMEKYMKNLEYKKINKYLDYIKNRI